MCFETLGFRIGGTAHMLFFATAPFVGLAASVCATFVLSLVAPGFLALLRRQKPEPAAVPEYAGPRPTGAGAVELMATTSDQPLEGFMREYVNDPFGNRIELMQVSAR